MYGWTGKILNVDLTRGRTWREDLPKELLHAYLGGRGLGVRLLRDHFRLAPFDAGMPLIFAAGPLCGTAAPGAARLSVTARSPLTGTVFDSSLGGLFAWRLKGAGIDAIQVFGESERPVVLAVSGEGDLLLPADGLWGKGVSETVKRLGSRGSVAAVGPAGEKGVLFASIETGDCDAACRGGLGA